MDSIWRKSSYSGDNGGECVEVATAGAVLVRDTADRGGPVLTFTTDVWRAFTAAIRKPAAASYRANGAPSNIGGCPVAWQAEFAKPVGRLPSARQ